MKSRIRGQRSSRKRRPKSHEDERVEEHCGAGAIWWIEEFCRIPEGPGIGKKVKLWPWQRELLCRIYDNEAGTRRAILSFGRKNGKTCFAAMLVLYHLCGWGHKPNSHIYSAAQSRDQAGILFGLAAKMVRLDPRLAHAIAVRDTKKELFCAGLGTTYRALSAEAATNYGLSPVLIIHDEAGQIRGSRSELYDALETATAGAEKPLSIIISTQAPSDGDLLSILIDDAKIGEDPHTVLQLYTAPAELDPFSDEAIKAANPAFGTFQNADEVRAMAKNAKRMPAAESSFRNLILNQRVAADTRFIAPSVWKSCGDAPAPLKGVPVYAGLDLSAASDLTALVLIGKVKDKWHVHPTFWLPADGLRERSQTDRVPYDLWARECYLETVPGRSIDYEWVARWLRELFEHFDIRRIGFDRWNFSSLKSWLLKADFDETKIERHFVEVGQGFQSMSPALRTFEVELLAGRIAHGNHPVLAMCADNAVVVTDPAGNRKLSKQKSVRRIDGVVALAMAFGVAATEEAKPEPTYQMFVLGGDDDAAETRL